MSDSLESIAREIRDYTGLHIAKSCLNPVPGEGSARAELLLIGEAPGAKEDASGRPFVGASGKILDQLLASVSLNRDQVFITNVVKYRPPNNRAPTTKEILACYPWLERQVRLIHPLVIILLGRHSLERFLPGLKISLIHGHAQYGPGIGGGRQVYLPLYHPAAALHQGKLRQTLVQDFLQVPQLLDRVKSCMTTGKWPEAQSTTTEPISFFDPTT